MIAAPAAPRTPERESGIAERDRARSDIRRNPHVPQTRSAKVTDLIVPLNFRFFKHQAPLSLIFKIFDGFTAGGGFNKGSYFTLQFTLFHRK
jgi:hypothetical protein